MFWARTDAVRQLFSMGPGEYPEERGQLDGTVMHAIERVWCYLARANGYRYRLTRYFGDNRPLDILKL
jgi:lipopolysaccharide biosynthesis protein